MRPANVRATIRTLLAATVLGAATVGAAGPASASIEVGIDAEGPVVELQVQQQVLGDPDKAMIGAGVTTRATTAAAAMQQNATAMEKVLKRLDALGIPRERVQTSGITLNPQYNYRANDLPPQFLGYDATNMVTIELRDLEKVGQVMDWLVSEGATNLNGPTWGVIDDESRREEARKAAFAKAAAQAKDYAAMAGYSGVKLLSIEESLGMTQQYFERAMTPDAITVSAQAASPTRPGQVATTVGLTVRYELVR